MCKTESLALRKDHRLKVLEIRVPRGVFEPKSDETAVGWSKLCSQEPHDLYSSPSKIRMIM
jgi:hypothetical protein